MSANSSERIAAAWRELGLGQEMIERLLNGAPPDVLDRLEQAIEERDRLREEVERYRTRERQIAELIGARNPDKLMHDLRNVLNELTLLRAVVNEE